jgi:phosphoenolpyruvate-protein phosphotransferase (PTS system enzyme I)
LKFPLIKSIFVYMRVLSGISAAPGIAIGKTFLYQEDLDIPRYTIPPEQTSGEMKRFLRAAEEAAKELQSLGKAARDKDQKAIFAAHRLMVEDPDFHYKVKARLESKYENIEWIVFETVQELARKLLESPDEYLRERAADLTDVSRRIIKILLGLKRFSLADLEEDVILAVRNLLPTEVLAMNRERVKALVMDAGSRTSHTAIILRSFGIPGVLGLSSAVREITNGSLVIVDGGTGQVILEPDAETLSHYQALLESKERSSEIFSILRELSAETTDGCLVSLKANIGIPEEAGELARYGAEGIGLFRSEFLFLQKGRNSEEAQLEAYSRVIKTMKGKPVTIRTVDLGGDKVMPVMQAANEENPLLGWRAIRFSLALPEMFKTQLRAILRAGVYGKARIMFPMISGIEELEQALVLLEEARKECRKKGQHIAEDIETGTMIEIPSAAITADVLAEKSDFFSIGTNDLMQYTLAVDRGNEKVTYLARSAHPAVLKLIKQAIDAAHTKGIPAAICGELARDPEATALLLGMGLDEFSMAAASIPHVKHIIRNVSYGDCKTLADAALASTSCRQVKTLVRDWHRKHIPDLVFDSDMIPDNK